MKALNTENKVTLYKDLLPQTIGLREKVKFNIKQLLSDYRSKDTGNRSKSRKKTPRKKMGSHSLSELHHFQTYHKL